MSKTTVTRRYEFDYGHRVQRHGGKCKNLHGHRGVVEASVTWGTVGDSCSSEFGMVMDFGRLKVLLEQVAGPFDHKMVLERGDPLLEVLRSAACNAKLGENAGGLLEVPYTPTAEMFAKAFAEELALRVAELGPGAKVAVRFYETPNCSAYYEVGR